MQLPATTCPSIRTLLTWQTHTCRELRSPLHSSWISFIIMTTTVIFSRLFWSVSKSGDDFVKKLWGKHLMREHVFHPIKTVPKVCKADGKWLSCVNMHSAIQWLLKKSLSEQRKTRGNDVVPIWTNNGLIDVPENVNEVARLHLFSFNLKMNEYCLVWLIWRFTSLQVMDISKERSCRTLLKNFSKPGNKRDS